jgi:queuosine precursor transporter
MIYILMYLLAIVLANLSIVAFGPAASVVNAFLFIGLDLTARDRLHQAWNKNGLIRKMTMLIGSGSLISYALNRDAGMIALASFSSFAVAATIDSIAYHLLIKKSYLVKINGSNVFGAMADSLIFPAIAFGGFLPLIVLGQFLAKAAGGAFWAFVFHKIAERRIANAQPPLFVG